MAYKPPIQIYDETTIWPDDWRELPGWECPGGCGEIVRMAGGKPDFHGDVAGYALDVCCSTCAPEMIARHLPREEILRQAHAPRLIVETLFNETRTVQPDGSWPSDPRSGMVPWAWVLQVTSPDRAGAATLTLSGPNGVGKSMIAGELLVLLFREGVRSQYWIRASQIVDEHFSQDRSRYLRRLAESVGALVIDELGRGQSGEFAWSILGEVIDQRIGERKPTIITTNLAVSDRGQLSIEAADSAVFDRLAAGLLVPMRGPSRRIPK